MSLVLYGHPFSSYTQKALVALYETRAPFEFRCIDADHSQHAQEWLAHWPMAKFPVLVDGDRPIAETSVIIEYLLIAHPGPVQAAVDAALTGDVSQATHPAGCS